MRTFLAPARLTPVGYATVIGVTSQVTRSWQPDHVCRSRLIRTARGAVIAVALALMVAAPAGAPTPPTRTVVVLDPVRQFLAGTGCEFGVTAHRIGRTVITDYSDGRETVDAHYIDYTIVNDANGKRFVTNFVHHEVDRYDAAANVYRGQSSGVSIYQFLPGDVGPDGQIVDHWFAINVVGTVSYVVDGTTFATSDISIQGRYTDTCAAIS